jgi:DNA (cytosine-5)-methyltransferase 1
MTEDTQFRFLSVCSGIEAASVAWEPLGWKACAFAEIEKFPSAVLAHHWPETPNLGDITKHHEWTNTLRPDLIVGGTPCQAFSVAGLRKGLEDPRGNLTLVFLGILAQFRPRWVVWENVPGVLSDKTGAFGAFLGGLGELGYGFAYRVLDAQYFGVAQRRRRVFVVGYLGDWRRAAAVLFEPESMRGDPPPSREKREGIASGIEGRSHWSGGAHPCLSHSNKTSGGIGMSNQEIFSQQGAGLVPEVTRPLTARMVAFGEYECDGTASTLKMRDYKDATDLVAHSLRGEGFDASEDGTGRGTPIVPTLTHEVVGTLCAEDSPHGARGLTGLQTMLSGYIQPVAFRDPSPTLTAKMQGSSGWAPQNEDAHLVGVPPAVAFAQNTRDEVREMAVVGALAAEPGMKQTSYIRQQMQVRRLTPRECERLQGFPDDHTLIPWRGKMAPDGPRYKALGNSMAVPVMRWIGERIQTLDKQINEAGNE